MRGDLLSHGRNSDGYDEKGLPLPIYFQSEGTKETGFLGRIIPNALDFREENPRISPIKTVKTLEK